MKRILRSGKAFSQKTHHNSYVRAHILGNPFRCKYCGKEFSQKTHLESHVIDHTGERSFKCNDCGKVFSQKSYLRIHMRVHTGEKPFKCNDCGKAFSRKTYLENHMRVHTGEKPFKCNDCGKAFSQKTHLESHMRVHTGEKPFKCNECGKAFSRKTYLESHMRVHTGEKPFKCNDCGKAFSQKTCLESHMRVHTGEKPFKCNDCGKAFSGKTHLECHMRVHTGEKPFKCNGCGKAFSHKSNLKIHTRVHTGEKPFKCNDCGKAFSLKASLKIHMRIHTGEKPFTCNDCGKAFSQKTELECHMRVHTGEKPFKCSDCGKAFFQKGHFNSHMRVHTGEKPFKCNDCGKAFFRRCDLHVHMRVHTREKPFKCNDCGKAFSQKTELEHHMTVHIHSTIITKKRPGPLEEMEQLLVTWMYYQIQKHMPLSLLTIQTKAHMFFEEVRKNYDDAHTKDFVASHGWFQHFKTRHNFHSVKISDEAASTDAERVAKFKDALHKIIVDEGYLPDQIFNVDETGLYWKRMPERSYIHKESKMMPGFKAYEDRLTLLLGGNVVGYKLKPFMIHHSGDQRALARISKHALPVHYRHNKKAWMTALLFKDWFVHCFIPEVKEYCRENNIPFKILLILDNAPGHPQHIGDINENIKVVFLPPNTNSLIQPMDQGAMAMFKACYIWNTFAQAVEAVDNEDKELRTFWKEFSVLNAILNIGKAWMEVKKECMNGIWKNLLQVYVDSFKGFNKDGTVVEIKKNIVSLGKILDLELEEEDIQELIDVQDVELTAEDLIELAEERKKAEEIEEESEQKFMTKTMAEAFASVEHGMKLFSEMDVNLERFAKVERGLQDVLAHYRVIYEEQKKHTVQVAMDAFLKNTTPVPSPSTTFEPRPSTSREPTAEKEHFDKPAALSSPSSSSDIY
ncbi:uncharacterized protein [Macrobrachium rosenbergii]|uniref:uncharacterized protein n=1 Tax=Macrobrachium rosenbergii TaxID=79674 RepID=UPI0034D5526E